MITNLDSFLYKNSKHKPFLCRNCLNVFTTENALNNHREICLNHKHCNEKILKLKNQHFKSRLPVVIYCDFEYNNKLISSSNPNPNKSYTNKKFKQEINSFGSEYYSYIGEDAKEKFIENIIMFYDDIINRLSYHEKKKHKLTYQLEKEFQQATNCYNCGVEFSDEIKQIREHNHYLSKYRGAS
ncbi:MAG: hypothetical protein ACWIPI_11115, partial [Polaribacter sp.]